MVSGIMEVGRKDFHHPFEPYEIQNELMAAIYDCIAEGKVGIFESPTGRRYYLGFQNWLLLMFPTRHCTSKHISFMIIQAVPSYFFSTSLSVSYYGNLHRFVEYRIYQAKTSIS